MEQTPKICRIAHECAVNVAGRTSASSMTVAATHCCAGNGSIAITHLFISHWTRDGGPIAQQLSVALGAAGHCCWIARRDVKPGVPCPGHIVLAIEGSAGLVLLVTKFGGGATMMPLAPHRIWPPATHAFARSRQARIQPALRSL